MTKREEKQAEAIAKFIRQFDRALVVSGMRHVRFMPREEWLVLPIIHEEPAKEMIES